MFHPRINPVPRPLRGKHSVAAILDSYGGVRVVVSPRSHLKWNVRHDELCTVLPGFKIRAPVPWHSIPFVISAAHRYLDWWIKTRNDPDYHGFREHITMYGLRKLENPAFKRALHLPDIVET